MVRRKRVRAVKASNNRKLIQANQGGIRANRRRITTNTNDIRRTSDRAFDNTGATLDNRGLILDNSRAILNTDTYVADEFQNIVRQTNVNNRILTRNIQNVNSDIGGSAQRNFENRAYEGDNKTPRVDFQNRHDFIRGLRADKTDNSYGLPASEIIAGLTDKLYTVEVQAGETVQSVNDARDQSINAIAGLLAISTATFSALGSVLDVANQTLLATVFTAINTVRTVQTAIAVGSGGLAVAFTAIVGVASIGALLFQSYQIRQNQANSAQIFGQIGASLQAVTVIGAIA